MPPNFVLISEFTLPNKYSISCLIAALEIDPFFDNLPIKIFRNKIKREDIEQLFVEFDKIIILFSLMSYQIKDLEEKIKILKSFGEKIIIISGGPHPTARPQEILNLGCDFVVVGEGEQALRSLLKHVIQNSSYEKVNGLAFIKNNTFVVNENKELIDLNDYPICSIRYHLWSPIEISRGCPFACSFCSTPAIFGKKMRFRSVENIEKGLKEAVKTGYDKVWFLSSNALSYDSNKIRKPNIGSIKNLLKSIKNIKEIDKIFFGTFPSEIRPDYVNENITEILEYISNSHFVVGGQHGSNSMLKKLHRGHTKEDVLNAIDILKRNNIDVHLDMIFGFPDETQEEEDENIEYMKSVCAKGVTIHSHYFMPLPNTKLEKSIPKSLSSNMKKIIGELARKGSLYGQWIKQTEISNFLVSRNS